MATSKKRTLALKLALWQCLGIATLWMLGACTLPYVATTAVASQPSQSLASPELIAAGLNQPVGLANARDGSGRIFVIEKQGVVRVIEDGQLAAAPFLDITPRVGSTNSEQGLLGLAFAPDFPASRRFYVNYTDMDGNTVISRFTVAEDGAADPSSEEILLQIVQPARNHNGGHLAFGPDGMLWIGTGDGGGDNGPNAQNPTNLLGKMLRIDVSPQTGYVTPPDNPWVNTPWNGQQVAPEVWAMGLRNPWRYSFDRKTGELWLADVGQSNWEEVNYVATNRRGGHNFGWPIQEAHTCYKQETCDRSGLTQPFVVYSHNGHCSVTGGHVYRGTAYPEAQGSYIFGDYCSGVIWAVRPTSNGMWETVEMVRSGTKITSFGEDEVGEILVADYKGQVFRLAFKAANTDATSDE